MNELQQSLAAGYGCLSAWADLLDRINVFPVADGDTGTNLRISLAPLRDFRTEESSVVKLLAQSATGNSGNIAAAFFGEFCKADDSSELADWAEQGRQKAWQAIARPRAGTMLTVFDGLASTLAEHEELQTIYTPLCRALQGAVGTAGQVLPELAMAGVVDSGALAMYIFFEGFFSHLTRQQQQEGDIFQLFPGQLAVNSSYKPDNQPDKPADNESYCVDLLMEVSDNSGLVKNRVAEMGESVVVVEESSLFKIHLHSPEPERLRGQLAALGNIVCWSAEEIDQTGAGKKFSAVKKQALHIITDAAGSIPRPMAKEFGISLLDSYIVTSDQARPESLYSPEQLYQLMRRGGKVTTAQAATFERHQHYSSLCRQYGRSLYLVVGSAFTGNYSTVMAWKRDHDPHDQLTVLDTGAASGRLGLIALLTARKAAETGSSEQVVAFAQKAIDHCRELVFIDELKYLVAGGRVSRASGFFGDLLTMKPVISPTGKGVQKVGMVHSKKGQLAFALKKLRENLDVTTAPVILLQYSDNEDWVADLVGRQIRSLLPEAEILVVPLSLTSGVHMGPGTWSLAFCPREDLLA